MDIKSNKMSKPMSLEEAINEVEAINNDKKLTVDKFMKIYDQYQKQKGISPKALTDLISKGIECLQENENKLLLQVYIKTKTRATSNPYIQAFIRDKCVEKLNNIRCEISVDTVKNGFYAILHKGVNESDSFKSFIKDAIKKSKLNKTKKDDSDNIIGIIYMFLAEMIEETYNNPDQRTKMLIVMERAFVEEVLSISDKDIKSYVCQFIPQYLAKGDYEKQLSSMCYLYYDFQSISQSLSYEANRKQTVIDKLNSLLEEKNKTIEELSSNLNLQKEENEKLKLDLQQAMTDKEEAEDRLDFETNRIERQYHSQTKGIAKKYNNTLGLEIDGIEDVIQFLSDDAKDTIQERIDRMRQKLSEIGGE